MAKHTDIGSKRLISLAPDAWVQWILERTDVTTRAVLGAEFQWISRESDVLIRGRSCAAAATNGWCSAQCKYCARTCG